MSPDSKWGYNIKFLKFIEKKMKFSKNKNKRKFYKKKKTNFLLHKLMPNKAIN